MRRLTRSVMTVFCVLKAQFILKTDDDQYVDLYEALVLTSRYSLSEQYVKNRFILCPVLRGLPILVRKYLDQSVVSTEPSLSERPQQ